MSAMTSHSATGIIRGAVLSLHDRWLEHPNRHLASHAGILQADGYNRLYLADR